MTAPADAEVFLAQIRDDKASYDRARAHAASRAGLLHDAMRAARAAGCTKTSIAGASGVGLGKALNAILDDGGGE